MLNKWHLYLLLLLTVGLPPRLMAVDGGWVEFGNPYRIGTIGEVSAGYDAYDSSYIFAASISDSGWLWMTQNDGLALTGYIDTKAYNIGFRKMRRKTPGTCRGFIILSNGEFVEIGDKITQNIRFRKSDVCGTNINRQQARF